jgi:hypothetical protein
MAFKLGRERGLQADRGQIKSKLSFKSDKANVIGTPIIRKDLGPGIGGEANMDGSIYINSMIEPGSSEETQILIHEMRHATDIKLGKLAYEDDHIMFNGEKFPRETIDGRDMILIDGKWKEAGHTGFPWEDDANNGNK